MSTPLAVLVNEKLAEWSSGKSKLSDRLFDRRIWLKGHRPIIDERRVVREKARWGKDYFPEDHPDSYFAYAMNAFARYQDQYHPESRADFVIETT